MSRLKFAFKPSLSPPDKYRWMSPLGVTVVADEKYLWLRKIKQHCLDNDIPLSEGWEADAEDQLCRVLPPGMCSYEDGSNPTVSINLRMTQDDWLRGMKVLLAIAVAEDPLVDQATAEARARTCAACPANVKVHGCGACVGIADAVTKIRGSLKTEADGSLYSCGVCKCANKAQVWVKPELLAKGMDESHRQQFALLPWCWKNSIPAA